MNIDLVYLDGKIFTSTMEEVYISLPSHLEESFSKAMKKRHYPNKSTRITFSVNGYLKDSIVITDDSLCLLLLLAQIE
jgi:hypothetical protein